jgi:hypothetical protein
MSIMDPPWIDGPVVNPEYITCPYCGEKSDEAGRIIHGPPCAPDIRSEDDG